jgi:aminoglycoside phosphotransferase family enzyme
MIGKNFYLYDRIEFNEFLRYADIAEDVAHLAMELEFHEREDLTKNFISSYIRKSRDHNMKKLIYCICIIHIKLILVTNY